MHHTRPCSLFRSRRLRAVVLQPHPSTCHTLHLVHSSAIASPRPVQARPSLLVHCCHCGASVSIIRPCPRCWPLGPLATQSQLPRSCLFQAASWLLIFQGCWAFVGLEFVIILRRKPNMHTKRPPNCKIVAARVKQNMTKKAKHCRQ